VNVTTPPRRPVTEQGRDLDLRVADLEALIKEARRRARRRRQRHAGASLLIAAAGAAVFFGFGGRGGGGAGTAAPRAPGSQAPAANADSAPLGALPSDAGTPQVFAFDPRDSQIVYVMTRGHVFKTTDGGAHWRATATSGSGWVGANEALTADPRHPGTLFAGTQVAVYKTVDGGRNWRPSKRGLFVPHFDRVKGWVIALAVDPANTDIVYAGSDRVSKSSDGGHSWKAVFAPHLTQSPRDNVSALAIAPTRPEAIYAIKSDFANGRTAIYKSTDAGTSWHATTSIRGTYAYGFATALAVDPRHPATVYAAIGANVLKTTNAGESWQPIAGGLPIVAAGRGSCHCQGGVTALAVDPRRAGTVYAAPTQGGIYKTTNGGQTWIRVIDAPLLEMYAVAVDPARPATVYAAGQSEDTGVDRILRSTDSGHTWASSH
jgi:photosystem II stability/assembly factor-like uncharacterized protein